MKKDWKWQVAFVAGIILCIILIDSTGGSATFTRLSALSGICLELLNFMFGGTRDAANREGWAAGKLKRLLKVTPFLKFATLMVWLLVGGLSSYSGFLAWKESKLLTVQGFVQDSDGTLAASASVNLNIGRKSWATLANQGKYSFSKLDLHDETATFGVVEAQWNGKKASKRIDLTTKQVANAIIRLPLGRPPFRVQYYVLAGHSMDFFLKGIMDEHWEKELAGQPYIVPNSTFKTLSTALTKFSEPFRAQVLMTPDYYAAPIPQGSGYSPEALDSGERLAAKFRGMPMFVGTDASPATASMEDSASRQDIESLSDPGHGWHVTSSPYGLEHAGIDSLTFWRFGTPADLQRFAGDRLAGRLVNWLQYATKDYFPKDFCIVSMSPGCSEPTQSIAIAIRSVHLRIAVIQNLTTHPIRLGSFVVRENSMDRLRSRDDDQMHLGQQDPKPYQWFPPQDLKPGENIAVPLEIAFGYDKDKFPDVDPTDKSSGPEFLNELRSKLNQQAQVGLSYYANRSRHTVEIPSDTLVRLVDDQAPDRGIRREYIYGPSTRVGSLEVDDAEYSVRQFDPHLVVIRSGNESGSCPFVYTYSSQENKWVSEGHILYGAKGRKRESSYFLRLTQFDGRVVLREEERETTFIKRLYVSAADRSGRRRTYYPTNWNSFKRTGQYVRLE